MEEESVDNLKAELDMLREQISFTEEMIESKNKMLDEMNASHQAQIQKLAMATRKAKQRQRMAAEKNTRFSNQAPEELSQDGLDDEEEDDANLSEDGGLEPEAFEEDGNDDDDQQAEEEADDYDASVSELLDSLGSLKEVIGREQLADLLEQLTANGPPKTPCTGGSDGGAGLVGIRLALENRLKEVVDARLRLSQFKSSDEVDFEELEKMTEAATSLVTVVL
mmetsp:Transcript_16935/g.30659  ORF Transcript_16935/g.30659 Transcript_16935/m.30659 type:complete len:223 (-) Transcript_16935:35-703(-)